MLCGEIIIVININSALLIYWRFDIKIRLAIRWVLGLIHWTGHWGDMMKDNSEQVFLNVFYAEGHCKCKQFQHENGHPLYDNVHPALPRPSMASTIHCPRCPWKMALGETAMACDHWLRQHQVQMINDAMHNRGNLEQLNNNKITYMCTTTKNIIYYLFHELAVAHNQIYA